MISFKKKKRKKSWVFFTANVMRDKCRCLFVSFFVRGGMRARGERGREDEGRDVGGVVCGLGVAEDGAVGVADVDYAVEGSTCLL